MYELFILLILLNQGDFGVRRSFQPCLPVASYESNQVTLSPFKIWWTTIWQDHLIVGVGIAKSWGCVNPAQMRSSYPKVDYKSHDKLYVTPGLWSEASFSSHRVEHRVERPYFYCSKCPGWCGSGTLDCVNIPQGLVLENK